MLGKGFGRLGGALGGAGIPKPSAPFIALAQKIINAANAFTPRTVMSSPPTITRSADFASSTIGGGDAGTPTIAPNDSRIRSTSVLINQFSAWYGGWTVDDIHVDGGDGFGYGLVTNSRTIEISLGFGDNLQIQMRVNGQWISATDTALFSGTPSFNPRFITFDFGSTATRTIEFFLRHSQDCRGINLVAGATFSLPTVNTTDVNAAMFGDSYVEANGGTWTLKTSPSQDFGEIMGVVDIVPCGRSNQGYVLARDSHTISSRMVSDSALMTKPTFDVIYAHGSVNDWNQSATTLQTNIATGIAALMAAFPNTWIVLFSSFKTQNSTIDATHNAAIVNGAMSVADLRTIVIDTQALSWPVIAATSGTLPNGDAHASADGVHPDNVKERPYLTQTLMKPAVIAALKARCGIP